MFIPDMIHQVVELLKENDRYWFMQPLVDYHKPHDPLCCAHIWLIRHIGVIPASGIWIILGGDKGGGAFKMNFQIVMLLLPTQ